MRAANFVNRGIHRSLREALQLHIADLRPPECLPDSLSNVDTGVAVASSVRVLHEQIEAIPRILLEVMAEKVRQPSRRVLRKNDHAPGKIDVAATPRNHKPTVVPTQLAFLIGHPNRIRPPPGQVVFSQQIHNAAMDYHRVGGGGPNGV